MKSSSSFPKRKTLAILFLNSRCSRTFRQDLFMPQLSHSHEWLLGHEVNDLSLVRVFKTLLKPAWVIDLEGLRLEEWRRTLHPLLQVWMKSSSSFPAARHWHIVFLKLEMFRRTFRQDLFMPQLSHSHEWLLGHEVNDSVFSKSF